MSGRLQCILHSLTGGFRAEILEIIALLICPLRYSSLFLLLFLCQNVQGKKKLTEKEKRTASCSTIWDRLCISSMTRPISSNPSSSTSSFEISSSGLFDWRIVVTDSAASCTVGCLSGIRNNLDGNWVNTHERSLALVEAESFPRSSHRCCE